MENTRDLAERLALEVFDNCSADYFDYYDSHREEIVSYFEGMGLEFVTNAYALFENAFELSYNFDTDCVCHVCNSIADMYMDTRINSLVR